jgi:rubrerythrin
MFYSQLAARATNPEAQRKLKRLADDEKRHIATLVDLFRSIFNDDTGKLPEKGIGPLAKAFDGENLKQDMSEMQYIDLAIEVELAVTQFYKDLADGAPNEEIKKIYQGLAGEEYTHFEVLQAEKDALTGNYYWFGYDDSAPLEQ